MGDVRSEYKDDILIAFEQAHAISLAERLEDFKNGTDKSGNLFYFLAIAQENEKTEASEWIKKYYLSEEKPKSPFTPRDNCILGLVHYCGLGVTQNYQKARQFFKKAAAGGDVLAKCYLGGMHYRGFGVTQDRQLAVILFKEAVDQNFAMAQYELGDMFFYGNGVPEDKKMALSLLKAAAEQGHLGAFNFLGVVYNDGLLETGKDEAKAIENWEIAARKGYAESLSNLGVTDKRKNENRPTAKTLAYMIVAAKFSGGVYNISGIMDFNIGAILITETEGPFYQKEQAAWRFRQALEKECKVAASSKIISSSQNNLLFLFSEEKQTPAVCYHAALGFRNEPDSPEKRELIAAFNQLFEKDFSAFYKLFTEAGDELETVKPLLNKRMLKQLQEMMPRSFAIRRVLAEGTVLGSTDIINIIAGYDAPPLKPKRSLKERKTEVALLCIEQRIWKKAEPVKGLFGKAKNTLFNKAISQDGETRTLPPGLKTHWDEIQKAKRDEQSFDEAWKRIHQSIKKL